MLTQIKHTDPEEITLHKSSQLKLLFISCKPRLYFLMFHEMICVYIVLLPIESHSDNFNVCLMNRILFSLYILLFAVIGPI